MNTLISNPTPNDKTTDLFDQKSSSNVDVLIIGAGPAGLMAAASLTRYGVHNIRIVDKRATKIFTGQADGLNPRSLEVLQALGIGNQVMAEANELGEICFWNPNQSGRIHRTARIPDTIPEISRYRQSTVHQGRIERIMIDAIAAWSSSSTNVNTEEGINQTHKKRPITVERAVCPDLIKLPSPNASALSDSLEDRVIVRLRHLSQAEAKPAQFSPLAPDGLYRSNMFEDDALDASPQGFPTKEVLEEVKCRYVIGADGARSWTRGAIGFKLEGESSDFFWGVVDGIPATDFPDIRMRCCIHSAEKGSVMIIPREKDLIRLYIQIPQPEPGKRPNRADVTPEKLMTAAKAIFEPYTINIPKIEWFTCYEIGQRLADHWSWNNRIFIAGDACHTHSPKAGQGMNTSMADTFNLTWKIAHVLQRKSDPKILSTYEIERSQVASELIEFDQKFAALFSGKPAKDVLDVTGISLQEFQQTMERGNQFASGTSVNYQPSTIVAKPGSPHNYKVLNKPELASKLPIGPRLYSHQVVCLSDAKPYHLADISPADGKWRLIIFGGNISKYSGCKVRLNSLAKFLGEDQNSPIKKFTPINQSTDSVIDTITILASKRTELEPDDFLEVLRPLKGKHGFRSYQKIFTDDESYHQGHGQAYKKYGIDPKVGCVVLVRPDQYVSLITDINDHQGIAGFFDDFMVTQNSN
ncbi:hypothetical protein CROQUDRAFT_84681 [Cronartium quercuum f. sp. fusiforme G11]|uniref:Phenol 2-monooxygenase n=1 Tax=Cronartium quercuum f. sp. fusiforme G11 TaxID=708437 RepID=A0A9P6N6H9_9BASI|nr:hypothetical protein CROQUDRAFT_84681 [Cronartium quercuum f. sp. fusiforme G11]